MIMKTKIYFLGLLAALLCFESSTYAKLWRVNNRTDVGIKADFTSLQGAIDSAFVQPGDTVYIEPSPYYYGYFYCNKKLVIIGAGYFLGENPETQVSFNASILSTECCNGSPVFAAGSDGTKIIGVSFYKTYHYSLEIYTSDICFQRCYFSGLPIILNTSTTNNIQIIQCYIAGSITNGGGNAGYNILIKNNYILGDISLDLNHNGVIMNNIIAGNISVNNFNLQNNIMIGPAFNDNGNCTFQYNISSGTQFGASGFNQVNVAMDSVFVCWTDCNGFTTDSRYQLKADSKAKGTGAGGVDIGIFGGQNPYVLSGLPNIPAIYKYTIWNSPNTINVLINAKSHK
jgi:hypothetical protein